MTYVADTHALVLFASGDLASASRRALRVFRRAAVGRDRVHVPSICFFEVGMLLDRGRVRSARPFDEWHDLVAAQPGLVVEPLGWDDVREARGLAGLVDPFDRLIAGTAVRLEATLLTGDARIRRSGLVPTLW